MGKLSGNSGGVLTGLVGTVVFVKGSNGESIVRSKPTKSRIPVTLKKQQNRNKFALMQQFTGPIYPFFKYSFTDLMGKKIARDAMRSYYLNHVFTLQDGVFEIDYARALMSTGRLYAYVPLHHHFEDQTLQLDWVPDTQQPFAEATDLLTLIAYSPQLHKTLFFQDCATRAAGTVSLNLSEAFTNTGFELWATFSDAEGIGYSYSTYLGRF